MDDSTQLIANTLRGNQRLQRVGHLSRTATMAIPPVKPRNSGPKAFTAPVLPAPAFPSALLQPEQSVHGGEEQNGVVSRQACTAT